jgi:hypothetical protein
LLGFVRFQQASWKVTSPVLVTGPSRRARLDLLDEFLNGVVNDLLAGAAKPLVTDHPFGVEQVNRRGAGQVPLSGDGSPSRALSYEPDGRQRSARRFTSTVVCRT